MTNVSIVTDICSFIMKNVLTFCEGFSPSQWKPSAYWPRINSSRQLYHINYKMCNV